MEKLLKLKIKARILTDKELKQLKGGEGEETDQDTPTTPRGNVN